MRQLAYGVSADSMDDYYKIEESTAINAMKQFCMSVVNCFEDEFLCPPSNEKLQRIEKPFADFSFPGCMGCLDCAGWDWGQCPKALQGIMVGKDGVPTLRMEVICDLDLRI